MSDPMPQPPAYYTPDACDLAAFTDVIDQTTDAADVPHAAEVVHTIPVYDMADLRPRLEDPQARQAIMGEWARVLRTGAGVVALRRAYADTTVLDEATAIYEQIIAREKEQTGGGGDHFATAGANDRVWNALQKLCEAAPDVYVRYFANTTIAAISEAWLGPHYQMTAQVNLVHPGGAAQQAHRDYHLGFQSAETSAQFPAHVHVVSPMLTLQGAVAHCDMPVESGPTKLLPFSQAYLPGYAAWRRDDFRALFEARQVQLPLSKGDTVFFNPALFHAAGANSSTDIHRMANLLQVSSAFGRAMETVDRDLMCRRVYPVCAEAGIPASEMQALIAATAEGYSFPTNLDRDPPVGGLAPETQAAFFARALAEKMAPAAFEAGLAQMGARRQA